MCLIEVAAEDAPIRVEPEPLSSKPVGEVLYGKPIPGVLKEIQLQSGSSEEEQSYHKATEFQPSDQMFQMPRANLHPFNRPQAHPHAWHKHQVERRRNEQQQHHQQQQQQQSLNPFAAFWQRIR